jgi:hypothetical protein
VAGARGARDRVRRHLGGSVVVYIALATAVGFLIVAPLALLAMFVAFRRAPRDRRDRRRSSRRSSSGTRSTSCCACPCRGACSQRFAF